MVLARTARPLVRWWGLALLSLWPVSAAAGPEDTRDALDRLEELLELRIEDGRLSREDLLPAILVSTQARYEASQGWFPTQAIAVLQRGLGSGSLRLCEACMAPRAYVERGQLVYDAGPARLDEVVRLDELLRGDSQPARAAIWIDEVRGGVSVRIVDLRNGAVLFAQNVDPTLVELTNTHRVYSLSEELERRARGDSLTQAFFDVVAYPGQHVSLDWTDQWGRSNENLTGLSVSLFDPVVGVGACHYHRVEYADILVGGKALMSVPTAVARAFVDSDVDVIDPIVTGVGVVRVPLGRSNYGAVFSASTNGQVGVGISMMNTTLLPVLP
ncbi:MAG: hypothetical protein JXX28_19095 [Deltaproteobacteria bacterium]|nr:hypothetical protein [Deltaproteobacteria bacterium]